MRTETYSNVRYDIKVSCWTAYFRLFVVDGYRNNYNFNVIISCLIGNSAFVVQIRAHRRDFTDLTQVVWTNSGFQTKDQFVLTTVHLAKHCQRLHNTENKTCSFSCHYSCGVVNEFITAWLDWFLATW